MSTAGVTDGQRANQTSFNAAFMARNGDTDTTGKVSLLNLASTNIVDLQKFVNDLASYIGTIENDPDFKLYASNEYIQDGDSLKEAIEVLDNIARFLNDEIDAAKLRLDDAEDRLDVIENQDSTFNGNKTFTGNTTFLGTVTSINSEELVVEDAYITINKNGTDLTAENAGVEVERPAGNAALQFDSSLASFWKIGLAADLKEIIVNGVNQIVGGIKDFISGIKTDSIVESTIDAGVTVDGVLIKDGFVDGRDVSADGLLLDEHVADLDNPHETTAAQVGLGNVLNAAQVIRDPDFQTFSEKITPLGDDLLLIEDSADAFEKKYLKISNLPSSGGGGGAGEHTFKANGPYGFITVPFNAADALYQFSANGQITDVVFIREVAGTSGLTEIDIQIKPPAGSWTSIFTTRPQIQAAAGSEIGVRSGEIVPNTVAPVLTSSPLNVAAGTLMRLNITQKEAGNPESITAIVKF